jgi:hypothetical protein
LRVNVGGKNTYKKNENYGRRGVGIFLWRSGNSLTVKNHGEKVKEERATGTQLG